MAEILSKDSMLSIINRILLHKPFIIMLLSAGYDYHTVKRVKFPFHPSSVQMFTINYHSQLQLINMNLKDSSRVNELVILIHCAL